MPATFSTKWPSLSSARISSMAPPSKSESRGWFLDGAASMAESDVTGSQRCNTARSASRVKGLLR